MNSKLLFLLLLVSGTSVKAQIEFSGNLVIDNTLNVNTPRSAQSGDLDGDGDMDVIVASYNGDMIAWFENLDGEGGEFTKHSIALDVETAISVYPTDIDNDGDLDVIAASFTENYIKWYENTDGSGNFVEQQLLSASAVSFVRAEDVDGDGNVDIVWSSYENGSIKFFSNTDGLGTFSTQAINIGENIASISDFHIVDVDGDNDMDIVSSYAIEGGLQGVTWYRNEDGLGDFSDVIFINANVNNISSVYAGDLDSDGDLDVATTSDVDGKVSWYENTDGLGAFGIEQELSAFENEANHIRIADVDGDNDMDIIAISNSEKAIVWFENLNDFGDFGNEIIISSFPSGIQNLHISDVNGDGNIDFVTTEFSPSDVKWYENTTGLGNFSSHIITKDLYSGTSIVTSDLDGDGDQDIISANNWGNKLAWYENKDGLGDYYNTQRIISNLIVRPLFIIAVDIDADGDNDIVATLSNENVDNLVWFENVDGLGNFGPPQGIGDYSNLAYKPYAVDIDTDGDLDIALHGNDDVTWYENMDGLGTFAEEGIVIIPYWDLNSLNSIEFGDIDGDNDIDIVIGRTSGVRYYINADGQGTFASPTNQITGTYFQSSNVKVVDLDIDGDNDIVFAWSNYNEMTGESVYEMSWFENSDGAGTFNDVQLIATNTGYQDIVILDMDNDGDNDVVSGTYDVDYSLTWFENTDGAGDFGGINQVIASGIGNLRQIVAVDINQDNSLDIVSLSSDKILWFQNNGMALTNEITGTIRFDVLGDGCTENEFVNGIMVSAEGDTSTNATFSQNNGQFRVFTTDEGSVYTQIASQLPNYYQAAPVSFESDFVGFGNADQVDFCIEPIGTFNDLSISIYPFLNDPRPGFDTSYRLVYRNNGTTQLSGFIAFEFDDTKLNFLSASEAINTQTANTLSFGFVNLNPFETRSIELEFNIFPPPVTNIDDVLLSTVTIDPIAGDETEEDNVFELAQTVIGSYDPNDITVLEGNEIYIEDTDKYLHYLIRFQNTGTASAINVSVEHILDEKLDWSTMQLESLSHSGRIEIADGSDVQFIFDNINLPDSTTDEEGSNGFIAFKIKPKSNVVVGDIISGVAAIYFDFNPPIITNTASTEIVEPLSVDEFELNIIKLYPNPAKDKIKITSNQIIDKLSVLDINGRLLKTIELSHTNYDLDIFSYSKGVYFIEIRSGDSKSTKKFIKN